jgi:hypothetical protein
MLATEILSGQAGAGTRGRSLTSDCSRQLLRRRSIWRAGATPQRQAGWGAPADAGGRARLSGGTRFRVAAVAYRNAVIAA